MTNATGLPVTGMTAAQLPLSETDLMMVVQGTGAGANRQAPIAALRTFIGTEYDARIDGVLGGSLQNQTERVQRSIDTVAGLGGGRVVLPAGRIFVADLRPRQGVTLVGAMRGQTTLVLAPGMPSSDVIVSENFYSLVHPVNSGGPYTTNFAIGHLTIDGNAAQNTTNTRGRGLCYFGVGLQIVGPVTVVNCRRHGVWLECAPNALNAANYDGYTVGSALNVHFCNQARDVDDSTPSAPTGTGASVYINGPTDHRLMQLFVGWGQGSSNVKIGPKGAGDLVNFEFWGGQSPRPEDVVNGTGITRSGTTATISGLPTGHGLQVNDQFRVYGGAAAIFNIVAKATAVTANSVSYTLDSATGANYTGIVPLVKVFFPDYCVISECQDVGLIGNLSGGRIAQALVRRNGFKHINTRHNYLIARPEDDPTPGVGRFIQGGYQIGDAANGFTNVVDCYIDTVNLDILGPSINWDSSGGSNRVRYWGYTNPTNGNTQMTGPPAATDDVEVRIFGGSPYVYSRHLPQGWKAASDGIATSIYGRSSDSYGEQAWFSNAGAKLGSIGMSTDGTWQFYTGGGTQRGIWDSVGLRPGASGQTLGTTALPWENALLNLPTSAAGVPSKGLWRDAGAGNVVKQVP